MKPWQGSCIAALLVLLIGGASLFFIIPVGGAVLIGGRLVKPNPGAG